MLVSRPLAIALSIGCMVDAAAARGAVPGRAPILRLATGEVRPLDPAPPTPPWFTASAVERSASGRRYLVVVARDAWSDAARAELIAAGAEILEYLPERAYRVRVAPGDEARVRALAGLAWTGELPAQHKVDRALARAAEARTGRTALRVLLFAGEPPDRVLRALAAGQPWGGPTGREGAWRIEASLPGATLGVVLAHVAALPEVEAIETVRPMRPNNQDAVWVHQSFVGPSPQQTPVFDRGIFGCGEVVALADTGQDWDLCYFSDALGAPPTAVCNAPPCPAAAPVPSRRKDILYYNWSGTPLGDDDTCPAIFGASGHGTHTSGTVAGDMLPYADCAGFTSPGRNGGDGLAPGAKLVLQEMGDGFEYLNQRGGTLWNLADVAWQSGARIHSDSWGGACHDIFGECIPDCEIPYDSFARDADLAMWSHPDLLLVLAAGNAGEFCAPPVSVGTPANAKSPVTVGSLGHGAAATSVSSFSSRGPVFDGRLKPTLAAQGESTVSAGSDPFTTNNCDTCALDGTSMAAPTVAGLAALVREYYRQGFHVGGTRNPASGFVPSGALIKATLIDSAAQVDPAAPPSAAPDFDAGFGRVKLDRTLAFPGSGFALRVDDQRVGVGTGGLVLHAFDVVAGTPLRATLVWSDAPASLLAATARVNELRLEVVDPAGTVWFQTLDPATGVPAPTSDPSDPHDTRNVEERLVFDAPQPGRWIVRVRGVDVPMGPQPFALVVRGGLTDCPAPVAPGAPTLSSPANGQVLVGWSAVPGAARYNVYRGFGDCPGGAWIPVALGVSGSSHLDTTVSGGARYRYAVAATSDAAASCESPRSPCASIVPAGDCSLDPQFSGLASATSAGSSTCAVDLSWASGQAYCVGDVRYNVYRGTTSGFPVDAAHRVARCIAGTSYVDSAGLVDGVDYHYVVRAEDATTGHGGPCRGGNEEENAIRLAVAPYGPPVPGTWTDDAGDTGSAKLALGSWTIDATGGSGGSAAYRGTSDAGICIDLTSPTLAIGSPASGPLLTFETRYELEYDPFGFFGAEGSLGQVEIAVGPTFSNWTRVPLTPDYPEIVEALLNVCATTQEVDTYFTGTQSTFVAHSASLANWGGADVRLRFHLSGDYGNPGGAWWIDDVSVTSTLVPSACATSASGPPPVPDGASVPGAPLRVTKSGGSVALTWDATSCPAAAVNVYAGAIGQYASFTSGACHLPASGSATLAIGPSSWFLVVATDGASTDGSFSRNGAGAELSYGGSSAVCPAIVAHAPSATCP
jgi:hypothetical protein